MPAPRAGHLKSKVKTSFAAMQSVLQLFGFNATTVEGVFSAIGTIKRNGAWSRSSHPSSQGARPAGMILALGWGYSEYSQYSQYSQYPGYWSLDLVFTVRTTSNSMS